MVIIPRCLVYVVFVAVCARILCVCIVSARMSPLWGLWSLRGCIHQNGRSLIMFVGICPKSVQSLMFVRVSPRIWGLWYACHYTYQRVRRLSWAYAKGVSSPICLWFHEHGCEVSFLSVGVCPSVWGLQGLFGFASHGVRSLIWLGGYLLRYEVYVFLLLMFRDARPVTIYHCISGDMRSLTWVYRESVRFLIYWWLYVPGCEVSDLFMELILAKRTAMPIVSVISHDAWCHVSDLFEGAWPTVWSISSIPCVFPSMWGLSPGWGCMSHGMRPLIYLQVYSQDRCSPLSFER